MAQTVSAEELHAMFRFYYNRGNSQVMAGIEPDEIDLVLNNTQWSIQGDEFRAYRTADNRGFEASKERKRNLQTFINMDPVETDFTKLQPGKPARWTLPENHRYTISGKVSWQKLPKTFYDVTPFTHDEWNAAERNAFLKPSYWEPAVVCHGDVEEVLPQIPGLMPHTLRSYYLRTPELIVLARTPAQSFGMELPAFLAERLIQTSVERTKLIIETQGVTFAQALGPLTK